VLVLLQRVLLTGVGIFRSVEKTCADLRLV
jgi:hypothetical protein